MPLTITFDREKRNLPYPSRYDENPDTELTIDQRREQVLARFQTLLQLQKFAYGQQNETPVSIEEISILLTPEVLATARDSGMLSRWARIFDNTLHEVEALLSANYAANRYTRADIERLERVRTRLIVGLLSWVIPSEA